MYLVKNLLSDFDLNLVNSIGYYDIVLAKKKKYLKISKFNTTLK